MTINNNLAINRYDEYGIPASTNVGRFQYTGQAWLPEIGMYYYKARIYSPNLGRFMQSDPIGYGAGMNMYAYVGGDPVNFSDPLGLKADPDTHFMRYDLSDIVVVAQRSKKESPSDPGAFATLLNIERLLAQTSPFVLSLEVDPPIVVTAQTSKPQKKPNNPCEGSKSDFLDAAEYVLDFAGGAADAASLGLAGAGVLAAEAPPLLQVWNSVLLLHRVFRLLLD